MILSNFFYKPENYFVTRIGCKERKDMSNEHSLNFKQIATSPWHRFKNYRSKCYLNTAHLIEPAFTATSSGGVS